MCCLQNASIAQRQTVNHESYSIHCFALSNGLAGVACSDQEYPDRAAHNLVNTMLESFQERKDDWSDETRDFQISWAWLRSALQRYQAPDEADKLAQIDQEIAATKKILYKTIDAAITRGEKLEDLMMKSEDISDRSKVFLKEAKKANKCCVIL
eukprot:TRINITY_DN3137_c0_g1_i3.p1 TRINITY_DN3137_c0_g1~~TRINITY_DN3137_c0_g1_i3.p1  ORF type:complete len:154 (-),score=43.87 TRINITY_DN3137_c0_g1_i3:57-518(-)